MVLKRPFGDEESCEHPWKQSRQLEYSDCLTSFVDIISRNGVRQKSHVPDLFEGCENERGLNKCQYGDRLVTENVATDKKFQSSAPSNLSNFSRFTSSTSEDDLMSEGATHLSYFPGFFESYHSTRPGIFESHHSTRSHIEDGEIYTSVFDHYPRKHVSIGPDHQADVPVWEVHDISTKSVSVAMPGPNNASHESLGPNQNIDDGKSEMLMGTCVIPMRDSESLPGWEKGGNGRTDCSCEDEGSVRCVRQHIMEGSAKLMGTLGQETFVKLGFYDMGEGVAKKWSEDEQHVFNEVVFSNPASMGKNFWDHLSVVFPTQTKKEIVSYYFNVFMLRMRGEQNRLDPFNIDSDNDEWQGSEDGDDEPGTTEEDGDSAVESPADLDYPLHNKHYSEDHECGEDESCDNYARDDDGAARVENKGRLDFNLEARNGNSSDDCCSRPAHLQSSELDHDLQDDSCTSYECQFSRDDSSYAAVAVGKQGCRVASDHNKHFQNNYDGLNSMSNLGYHFETCDSKAWDVGFFSSFNTDVDLLPTFNMIDEVFGVEGWSNKGRDGHDMN